jgi:hypothetical protein
MDFRFDRSRLGAVGNADADRSPEQQSSTTGRLRHAPSDAPKGFFALVEKNQLFFRIVGETPEAPADLSRAFIRNVISDFRKVFTGVWNRIPPGDRQILLDYWRGRDMLAVGRGPWYRPLIQVFEILPEEFDTFDHGDCRLSFRAPSLETAPDQIRFEIASALAKTHRFATRAHWRLAEKLMWLPMDRWEQRHPDASDAAHEKKWARLEKAYLPEYHREIETILRQWGMPNQPA